jgi:hypothetical protein
MMGLVLIKCPIKGMPVPTGFSMGKAESASPSVKLEQNAFQCPACHQMHVWDKKDAWVD